MTDLTGKQLGDYRILKPIGAGGMGEVYLAEHLNLKKRYAVKVLPRELAHDQNFVEDSRFKPAFYPIRGLSVSGGSSKRCTCRPDFATLRAD